MNRKEQEAFEDVEHRLKSDFDRKLLREFIARFSQVVERSELAGPAGHKLYSGFQSEEYYNLDIFVEVKSRDDIFFNHLFTQIKGMYKELLEDEKPDRPFSEAQILTHNYATRHSDRSAFNGRFVYGHLHSLCGNQAASANAQVTQYPGKFLGLGLLKGQAIHHHDTITLELGQHG